MPETPEPPQYESVPFVFEAAEEGIFMAGGGPAPYANNNSGSARKLPSGLSAGMIAGIVGGVLLLVGGAAVAAVVLIRRKRSATIGHERV